MPPPQEVDFYIDLAVGAALISKATISNGPNKAQELKTPLKELLKKRSIKLSNSP